VSDADSGPDGTSAIEPFEIRVDDAVLDDLRARLARTRFADAIDETGWEAGVPVAYLRGLVDYWREGYDWRAEEAALNALDHFTTRIDGQSIHFVHARSGHAGARPLLLVHGWPGSVVEFLDVLPRLVDPAAHGGDAADAFHVVAPSLPGYAFSEPTRTPGWDVQRIAVVFAELMRRLGHDRYVAAGGDWGAQVVTRLAALDPDHCAALHLTMPVASRPEEPVELSDADRADLAAMQRFQRDESGYAVEQGTKPETLGAALNDSPAGLLAWIVEKFRTWSDGDDEPERAMDRDRVLTNVMLYWVTGTITSSMRLYRETRLSDAVQQPVTVPTAVARFPKEVVRFPRAWVERMYHVVRWVDMPRGGHFAAMEQPELFVDDLRAFVRTLGPRPAG
jgi:microsomal epoxide hydrolase